jgi:hypothetical protein
VLDRALLNRALLGRTVLGVGTGVAVAGTIHAALNARLLRRPVDDPPPLRTPVSVLLPVRDEADRITGCLSALLGQTAGRWMEVLVLDDGSTDGTADLARRCAAGDGRVRVHRGRQPPPGWLGKPHACAQLAALASPASEILVFLDADVLLAPHAVAAVVDLLDRTGLDLVCPYPRQRALSVPERLVQPLLQWSWLTFLPLRLAERPARPSLTAANGQFLAVRRASYDRAGGHRTIRTEVLDDLALLRAMKRAGSYGGVADGTTLASCRMYRGWPELRDGYAKSLWSAFGSPLGAAGVVGLLGVGYVVPAVAGLRGSRLGLLGYGAGVAGRVLAARRTGGRSWPDAAAHPVSVLLLGWLTARSWLLLRHGRLAWKGRPVGPEDPTPPRRGSPPQLHAPA